MIPTGVPSAVPAAPINRLPMMAFRSPPSLPGGGVISRKSFALTPTTTALKKVKRIQPSQNNPNSIVSRDTARLKRLINSRRVYRSMASGHPALAPCQAQQQQVRKRQHYEGYGKQDEAELDQRRKIEVADRLGKFVGEGRCNAVSGLHERNAEPVSIADHESDRHGLTERPAQSEHDPADHSDLRVWQHHVPDHFPSRRAERVCGFLQYRRDNLEYVAHHRGDERNDHDGENNACSEDADSHRGPLEQRADDRD